jgi:hypothetical protein
VTPLQQRHIGQALFTLTSDWRLWKPISTLAARAIGRRLPIIKGMVDRERR